MSVYGFGMEMVSAVAVIHVDRSWQQCAERERDVGLLRQPTWVRVTTLQSLFYDGHADEKQILYVETSYVTIVSRRMIVHAYCKLWLAV
jgi:hypothetical protein